MATSYHQWLDLPITKAHHTRMETYLTPLLGGVLIGLAATLLMFTNGKICGVSGITTNIPYTSKADRPWRIAFLVGLILGPVLTSVLLGIPAAGQPVADIATTAAAGLLVGIGTTMGNGCTSGHGVCGMARLSKRSIFATLTFFVMAVLTVFLTHHVLSAPTGAVPDGWSLQKSHFWLATTEPGPSLELTGDKE